jgi:hypothetical protein
MTRDDHSARSGVPAHSEHELAMIHAREMLLTDQKSSEMVRPSQVALNSRAALIARTACHHWAFPLGARANAARDALITVVAVLAHAALRQSLEGWPETT